MAKRRRERDRPKAASDAPYNPNKRVLLSYASDDEQEEDVLDQPAGTGRPGAVDAISANYEIAAYPEDEGESESQGDEDGAAVAGPTTGAGGSDVGDGTPKGTGNAMFVRGVMKNEVTGQWPVLGSLSYQWDEDEEGEVEEYDSTEEEAMAYLRAVRSERQNLPTIIAASHGTENEDLHDCGVGDSRGYLHEGTYIRRPSLGPKLPASAKKTIDPQEAFTDALKKRFLAQREHMHVGPSMTALASLDDKHPTNCSSGNNRAYAEWTRLLKTTAPLPVQVRSMDQDNAFALLAMIRRMYLARGKDLEKVTSAWVWSLLARLDDVGTMNNDQVFELRELGKKAVLVQLSFTDAAAAQQLEAVAADEKAKAAGRPEITITEEDLDQRNNDAAQTSTDHIDDESDVKGISHARQNTLASLDIIITVIGEAFGQRDLLEFRRMWQSSEEKP